MAQATTRTRAVSPGEVIFSEGYVGIPAVYLIKGGEVEISVTRGESKIVLSTLGRGQFFGESILVSAGPRRYTARAVSYCELQVLDPGTLQAVIDSAPPFVKHMLRSLIQADMKKDEALASQENLPAQQDYLSYAHILALMASAEAWSGHPHWAREETVTLQIADVVRQCRDITGHSRHRIGSTLRHMAVLNLIVLDDSTHDMAVNDVLTKSTTLRVNPDIIVSQARRMAKHQKSETAYCEQELIDLTELDQLTGVDRHLLLRKLAQGEIADEIFTFRRSEVLRFIAEKGKDYFAKWQAGQLQSVNDLVTVDKRVLFEALNSIDEFALAKLFQSTDKSVCERLFACMSKAKRYEIEQLMSEGRAYVAEEVELVEDSLLDAVRALRRPLGKQEAPNGADNPEAT